VSFFRIGIISDMHGQLRPEYGPKRKPRLIGIIKRVRGRRYRTARRDNNTAADDEDVRCGTKAGSSKIGSRLKSIQPLN
jgi:hypothetical protein